MTYKGVCPSCFREVLVMQTADSKGLVLPHEDKTNRSRLGGCAGAGKMSLTHIVHPRKRRKRS